MTLLTCHNRPSSRHRGPCLLLTKLLLCLTVTVTVTAPVTAQADEQHYVYDPLGRLQKVIDPVGHAATYYYDAVGNLLAITRTVTQLPPEVKEITPSSGRAGEAVNVVMSGANLLGATLTTTHPGLLISYVTAAPTQITATFFLLPTAALGQATIQVTTGSGSAFVPFTILPPPPPLTLSPGVVEVDAGKTASLTVTLAQADPYEVRITLTIDVPAITTVSPTQVTIPPGQTTAPLTVTGIAAGTTFLHARSGSQSASAQITVLPVGLYFEYPVYSLIPGESLAVTVYLVRPAVAETLITLTTTDPNIANVTPTQVTIPAGQSSASATLTAGVGEGVTTLIATEGTFEARATVEVGGFAD